MSNFSSTSLDDASNDEQGTEKKAGRIRQQNTQAILDAAEQEFAAHGFRGTSMQAIADRAELPKANLHYYYRSKSNLYRAVLERIVDHWNAGLADISEEDDPAPVLEAFIRSKVVLSFREPDRCRLFTSEVIAGAPYLADYMSGHMRSFFRERVRVLQAWIDQGRMAKVDPAHLIFMIWASSQYYSESEAEILTLLNRKEYEEDDIEAVSRSLISIILRGCGLVPSFERFAGN